VAASGANRSAISSREYTAPVGLTGVLNRTTRVRGPSTARSSAPVTLQSRAALPRTTRGTPPKSRT
jgi:hypothetical protein